MSLIPAGFLSSGLLPLGTGPITHYSQGLPFDAAGAVVAEEAPVTGFSNGIPFTASGALAVDSFKAPISYPGGLPLAATGAVCVADGAAANYVGGVPHLADGRLASTGWSPAAPATYPVLTRNGTPAVLFPRDHWDAQFYGPQILIDPNTGVYKMFYSGYTDTGDTVPNTAWGPCMAESTDLVHWTKPNVGLWQSPPGSGNTDNNIIIWYLPLGEQIVPQYDLVDVAIFAGRFVALCMNQSNAMTQIWESTDGYRWAFVANVVETLGDGYAEPKSITFEGGVYRIYYGRHGVERRSIGFVSSANLAGPYVDQGLRPEFTSVAATLQYYDIRHWTHNGALWACVMLYNSVTQVLGPAMLYRSTDNGVTYTEMGVLQALGPTGTWDDTLITVMKPLQVGEFWRVIYSGSEFIHNYPNRPQEMGWSSGLVNIAPWNT